MESLTNAYLGHFKAKAGAGNFPVFKADPGRFQYGGIPVYRANLGRFQSGAGFGDILRSSFRTIFPILIRGASTFLGDVVKSSDEGASLRDAVAAAAGPAIGNVVSQALKRRQEDSGYIRDERGAES